ITNIEDNFKALKDMLVFGDLEDTIPALLESLENYEENYP
ncbi:6374_t:CDS:1, partial [Racocetra persica]